MTDKIKCAAWAVGAAIAASAAHYFAVEGPLALGILLVPIAVLCAGMAFEASFRIGGQP